MKHLLPKKRMFVVEFCKNHLGRTDHEMLFEGYNKVKHTVSFVYFCIKCLKEDGETQSYRVEIEVEDWLRFMELYEDSSDEN